jgi:catechol 2,3-dioxygenase-like lactoylglutathione lyase family enzyme
MTPKRILSLMSVVVFGSLATQFVFAQANNHAGYRLSVVGIAVKDYAKSQDFYGNKMGLREAFKFSSPDGTRTTTYYQLSKDTFLEMQPAVGDAKPGFTHVHLVVDNVDATIARLKQAGVPVAPRNGPPPGTVTEAGVAMPSNVKNSNIVEPDGLRLELNELLPESLTTKAAESWPEASMAYRLEVIGIAAKDFDASLKFYQNMLELGVGFTINNDPKHPYLQLSRDTFLELAGAGGNQAAGFTHVHLVVDDLTKTLARLKQSGMPVTANTSDARMPGSVTVASFSTPSQVYAAYISDPDNLRLELNQWVDSLPKRAAEAWK